MVTSITTKSTVPNDFFLFPQLPPELRQMVWNEAIPSPILDLQRFNAEIARKRHCSSGLVLCLTPNSDFIQLTRGHRGLLGACRDSRAAAIANTDYYLPINYIIRDSDGVPVVRPARVPFNPEGQLCISGLGPALHAASKGHGARGVDLDRRLIGGPEHIARTIECVSFSNIKNLIIALDPRRDGDSSREFLPGLGLCASNRLVRRMAVFGLETVELVDEGWLNERRHNHLALFKWWHNPAELLWSENENWRLDYEKFAPVHIPWVGLYEDFKSNSRAFKAFKASRCIKQSRTL